MIMKRKVALITGASRGIGYAVAQKFRQGGYEVLAPARSEMDLLDTQSIAAYCSRLEQVDVLVNNAGINTLATIDRLEDDVLEPMLQVNLKAPLQIVRALGDRLGGADGGRVVNLSSVWAFVSKEGRCGYTAAKSAIRGITQTLALELAPRQILVNAVAPGFVNTELTRQNNSPQQIAALAEAVPLGRLAEPEEIAGLVWFLGSDENTYITGQTFLIDGGYTCR